DLTRNRADETKNIAAITEFFEKGLDNLRAGGRLLVGIIDLWSALMGVSNESAIRTLDDFTNRLHNMADSLRENKEEAVIFFNETSEGFGYLLDIIGTLGRALIEVFSSGGVESIKSFSVIIDQIF